MESIIKTLAKTVGFIFLAFMMTANAVAEDIYYHKFMQLAVMAPQGNSITGISATYGLPPLPTAAKKLLSAVGAHRNITVGTWIGLQPNGYYDDQTIKTPPGLGLLQPVVAYGNSKTPDKKQGKKWFGGYSYVNHASSLPAVMAKVGKNKKQNLSNTTPNGNVYGGKTAEFNPGDTIKSRIFLDKAEYWNQSILRNNRPLPAAYDFKVKLLGQKQYSAYVAVELFVNNKPNPLRFGTNVTNGRLNEGGGTQGVILTPVNMLDGKKPKLEPEILPDPNQRLPQNVGKALEFKDIEVTFEKEVDCGKIKLEKIENLPVSQTNKQQAVVRSQFIQVHTAPKNKGKKACVIESCKIYPVAFNNNFPIVIATYDQNNAEKVLSQFMKK